MPPWQCYTYPAQCYIDKQVKTARKKFKYLVYGYKTFLLESLINTLFSAIGIKIKKKIKKVKVNEMDRVVYF